jgi:hypothetical protein
VHLSVALVAGIWLLVSSLAHSAAWTGNPAFAALRMSHSSGADLYLLGAWTVPALLATAALVPRDWLDPRRLTRRDWGVLLGIGLVAAVAMALVLHRPEFRQLYPRAAPEHRWLVARFRLVWILSWLPGWELLTRGLILIPLHERDPTRGWLAVPVLEGVTHLGKPPLEALGMVALSLVLTRWSVARGSVWPGLLAHGLIELILVAFQVL